MNSLNSSATYLVNATKFTVPPILYACVLYIYRFIYINVCMHMCVLYTQRERRGDTETEYIF